jgi:hypothetical protein
LVVGVAVQAEANHVVVLRLALNLVHQVLDERSAKKTTWRRIPLAGKAF